MQLYQRDIISKKDIEYISDRFETVSPRLARKILVNGENGRVINWLIKGKVIKHFLSVPLHKRDTFD